MPMIVSKAIQTVPDEYGPVKKFVRSRCFAHTEERLEFVRFEPTFVKLAPGSLGKSAKIAHSVSVISCTISSKQTQ